MTSRFSHRQVLPDKTTMESFSDGRIVLKRPDGLTWETKVAFLAYVLQEYQTRWGTIPVEIDFSQWRGLEGKR